MKIKVDFSFFALNALLFIVFSGRDLLILYSVCLSHELGHLFAMAFFGEEAASVELSAAGIIIRAKKQPAGSKHRSLIVLLSGPAVNLIIFAVLAVSGRGGAAAALNAAAAIYNLLPYRQLDGGAALSLFTSGARCERAAEWLLLAVKSLLSATLLVGGLVLSRRLFPLFFMSLVLLIGENSEFFTKNSSKSPPNSPKIS